jgi:hypothetical protein
MQEAASPDFEADQSEGKSMQLNAKTVAGLALPAGKADAIFFDSELPGFGYRLRKSAGGTIKKSWIAQYRHAGRTRRVLIGSAATISATDARAQAKKILATVALGNDPQGAKHERRSKDALSFRLVVDEFLAFKQSRIRPRTYRETRRYLTDSYFKPFHARAVDMIARKDIAARLVAIARENGSTSAARQGGAKCALCVADAHGHRRRESSSRHYRPAQFEAA